MDRIFRTLILIFISSIPAGLWADAASRLTVPDGFQVTIHAEDLGDPRGLALSPEGDLHVCDRKGGRVLRLMERKGEKPAVQILVEGLHKPHSLAFHDGRMYVGETDRVSSFRRSSRRLVREDGRTIVELPSGGGHSTRTILFGPDGKMHGIFSAPHNAERLATDLPRMIKKI